MNPDMNFFFVCNNNVEGVKKRSTKQSTMEEINLDVEAHSFD
jgi:hypothetical protein